MESVRYKSVYLCDQVAEHGQNICYNKNGKPIQIFITIFLSFRDVKMKFYAKKETTNMKYK